MATIRLAAFDADRVIFEADYNDGNRRVSHVRCINTSDHNARATVLEPDTKVIVGQATFLPGTTSISLGSNTRQVTIEPDGSVNMPYEVRLEATAP